jgi:hypothetical protein
VNEPSVAPQQSASKGLTRLGRHGTPLVAGHTSAPCVAPWRDSRESDVANKFQAGLFLKIVLKKGPATRLPHVSRQCGWRDSRESDVANTFQAGLFLEIVLKKGQNIKKKSTRCGASITPQAAQLLRNRPN